MQKESNRNHLSVICICFVIGCKKKVTAYKSSCSENYNFIFVSQNHSSMTILTNYCARMYCSRIYMCVSVLECSKGKKTECMLEIINVCQAAQNHSIVTILMNFVGRLLWIFTSQRDQELIHSACQLWIIWYIYIAAYAMIVPNLR